MTDAIDELLQSRGYAPVRARYGVGGGSISEASRLVLTDGHELFCKRHDRAPADFFAAEAAGLTVLRAARAVRVPEVIAVTDQMLLLEWLSGTPAGDYWSDLGEQLAQLHHHTAETFGFDADNYCGLTPQPNPRLGDGVHFFAAARLGHQTRLARDAGLLDSADRRQLERVADRLGDWIPPQPPSLIHGDLWRGNVHCGPSGEPVLVDPATHYGWAEAELAMTTLFGGFPQAFYDAYMAASGCRNDWATRADLYNLYHLLNHLNLFGGGYLSGVRAVLDRYVDRR